MTIHIVCESNKFCFYKHDHFDKSKNQFFHSYLCAERSQFLLHVSRNGWLLVCLDIKVVHKKNLYGNPFLQVSERKHLSPERRQSRINCNLTKIDY